MKDQIDKILKEKVDPILAQHYGGAFVTGITDENVVKVKLTGACASCPSAQYTIEDIVKAIVMDEMPEVKDVILDTSVSEDLIDFAKKLLNGEIEK